VQAVLNMKWLANVKDVQNLQGVWPP
jgi:hypothetical protein